MGLLDEQKIVSRGPTKDGGEEAVLECGHKVYCLVQFPEHWDSMRCSVCIQEFTKRYNAYEPPKKEAK